MYSFQKLQIIKSLFTFDNESLKYFKLPLGYGCKGLEPLMGFWKIKTIVMLQFNILDNREFHRTHLSTRNVVPLRTVPNPFRR